MTTPSLLEQAIDGHRAGRLNEAEQKYRAVLDEIPDQPDALALLGVLLGGKGRRQEAIGFIERAVRIDPRAALFKFYLGNALMAAGEMARAVTSFREAIALQTDMPVAHYNLGNVLCKLDAWDAAAEAYGHALRLAPGYAEARNNLALVHQRKGEIAEAVRELQRATGDKPDYAEAWLNLCKLAEKNGDFALSLEAGKKAVELMPQNPSAWLQLGVALNRLERHEEAEQVYRTAIGLRPDWTESWDNLAQTYQYMNRTAEAEIAFRKVIALAGEVIPDEDIGRIDEHKIGQRHWHLSLLELSAGDYLRGFARHRARFSAKGGLKRTNCAQPFWRGEDVSGKTVLAFDEEGCGDGLMMCRYLPLIKARGACVKFHVKPAFGPLFRRWDGVDEVIVRDEDTGPFDVYTWMFDLPYIFGTTLASMPARVPYLPLLTPDEDTRLAPDPRPRIGVVWAGSPGHAHDRRRSIPLEIFASLFRLKGFAFYSLNRDKREGDDARLTCYPVTDLAPRLHHFGDLARFVMQMDLVISCDTATAHLAGGLGGNIWTLLPFTPDWRWLLDREDSPWYPTMRLFRQRTSGDWTEVIGRVGKTLEEWRSRSC